MPLSYTIDRFEGSDWAFLEDESAHTFQVPRTWIPAEAHEGDVLAVETTAAASGTRELHVHVDHDATAARRGEATNLRDELPRGPKGDMSL